jgi:hypothetical protein
METEGVDRHLRRTVISSPHVHEGSDRIWNVVAYLELRRKYDRSREASDFAAYVPHGGYKFRISQVECRIRLCRINGPMIEREEDLDVPHRPCLKILSVPFVSCLEYSVPGPCY